MKSRNRNLALIIVLLSIGVLLPTSVLAGHEDAPRFASPRSLDSSLLQPFQKNLSSSIWLMTKGLDPRLTTAKGSLLGNQFPPQEPLVRGISPQASGGGQGPLVPYRSASPKFSRNILVTRDFSRIPFQTEPSLAINPKDPEHLLLGVIDYSFPGITTYASLDGGATWQGPNQVKYPAKASGAAGDPVVAFDRHGRSYAAAISVATEEFTVRDAVGEATVSSIAVARSNDGGSTWSEPIASTESHVESKPSIVDERGRTTYELSIPFLDKPWLAIGPSPDNPEEDIIYVTYTKFVTRYSVVFLFDLEVFPLVPVTETSIEMVSSKDGGITWSAPSTVSSIVESRMGTDVPKRVVQGSQPAVGQDGTLYVTWVDSTDDDSFKGRAEIYVAVSGNEGDTFDVRRAADFNEIPFSPRNTFFRYWGATFPQIAVGSNNEIYVVYTARPSDDKTDDGDVYLVASSDKGKTWSKRAINDDDTSRLQFFPAISVSPDGTVHMMWGDMRDDRVETRYHIYYSSSEDSGQTWLENTRVSDFPSNPNYAFPAGAFIGDYFTIKSTDQDVYMAWPDARLGEFGSENQKIAFARKTLMPPPSIFLSPPSGPGGKDITVQGSNFQPDQDVYLEISGVVISTVRTDIEGRFTARVFIPISGEGAHDFRAIDASGNIATGSFFMDFGFDNIQDSITRIDEKLSDNTEASENVALRLKSAESGLSQLENIQVNLDSLTPSQNSGAIGIWTYILITPVLVLISAGLGLWLGVRIIRTGPA